MAGGERERERCLGRREGHLSKIKVLREERGWMCFYKNVHCLKRANCVEYKWKRERESFNVEIIWFWSE